ncbi:hypothetical protein U1Q18_005338 [Sarracenia purpurea var. burkii]
MQAIEHELEVTVRVHEVRSEYERQMEDSCPQTMSPGARNSRIFALENMLATSSSTLVSMASQLSEAEERERAFSGRGRWNKVRSLAEAKNMMNYLFNLASSSRCQLRDKEFDCREKDSEIRELKEKIVNLVRQLEMQKAAALIHQEKLKKLTLQKQSTSTDNTVKFGTSNTNSGEEGRVYDLRPMGLRGSMVFNNAVNNSQLFEDMDTSESEHSDIETAHDKSIHSDQDAADDDPDWEASRKRRAKKRNWKTDSKTESKTEGSLRTSSHPIDISDLGNLKTEPSAEGTVAATQKIVSVFCCSCYRYSLCKTMRCECRADGRNCGSSCNCVPTKCTNREAELMEDLDHLTPSEMVAHIDDKERSQTLASHGAMLLQSALAEKPIQTIDGNESQRKPLSDIGNTMAKSNAPKPNQRKKWRKSVIQLVRAAPTAQLESTEAVKKPEGSAVETDIPLQLPRAMRSLASNNLLRERNAEQPDASVLNKDGDAPAPGSQSRQPQSRPTDEKENQGL